MLHNLLVIIFLFGSLLGFSQTTDVKNWRVSESDSMQQGFDLFEKKSYLEALPIFENLHKAHPHETFIKYCYGICALYRTDKHAEALTLLQQVHKKNNKIENIEYFLAKANHLNYHFEEALSIISSGNTKGKATFSDDIKENILLLKQYCVNAKILYATPTKAKSTNIGNIINTPNDEDIPLVSADESVIIFSKTDARPETKDIVSASGVYLSVEENGNWLKPALINKGSINDKAIAVSPDGLTLFLYHEDSNGNGDIYRSDFDYFEWSAPQKLKGEVNSGAWEGSCSMSADGKYLYFSSDRTGGLGGKDIYRATLLPNNIWGDVINLGENVNTATDDDCPFIHADGTSLFYSSKGRNSMGGYDIFQSKWKEKEAVYTEGINLGYPINSPDNDLYYTLSASGNTGYYASGKAGGEGLKDIYKISDGYVGEKPIAYVVKGVVTKAINVLYSDITIDLTTKEDKYLGEIKVNSVTGKYMAVLPADNEYKLVYKYKSFEYKTIEINTSRLQEPPEQIVDVFFDIKPELINTPEAKDSVNMALQKFEFTSITKEKLKLYNDKYGDISADGLEFMVQIAAYKYIKKYDFKKLKKVGKVTELDLKDGIMRFVIGGKFNTLSKAFDYNQKVIAAGQADAFVVILYKGKRVFLEELETLKIYVK